MGLPKARRRRTTQWRESDRAEVEGEAVLKATVSGPCVAASAVSRAATRSSASSQEIRCHPGSGSPLGRVRRIGCSRRPGPCTISGASFPFRHRALPVGWEGSGASAVSRPPVTVASAPQREVHRAQ